MPSCPEGKPWLNINERCAAILHIGGRVVLIFDEDARECGSFGDPRLLGIDRGSLRRKLWLEPEQAENQYIRDRKAFAQQIRLSFECADQPLSKSMAVGRFGRLAGQDSAPAKAGL
jgi:hypothetical protein